MADAFFYMYVVGAGAAAGVATIVFISWKVYNRSQRKGNNKKRKVGIR